MTDKFIISNVNTRLEYWSIRTIGKKILNPKMPIIPFNCLLILKVHIFIGIIKLNKAISCSWDQIEAQNFSDLIKHNSNDPTLTLPYVCGPWKMWDNVD